MNIHKDITGYFWYHFTFLLNNVNAFISKVIFMFLCFTKGVKIGEGIKVYGIPSINRFPLSRISIGSNCTFNSSYNSTGIGIYKTNRIVTVEKNAEIRIGNNVGLSGATILSASKIIIEDNVLLGAHSIIMDTDRHSLSAHERLTGKAASKPVHIKSGSWIGMNATILKGVTVGHNCIIGANSLVIKDIPDNFIAAGNPCKVIKEL
jgi:acetyltransferase-like isoleucine patch superfamily enzyme